MSAVLPAKRARQRQACEPCRRKKSKCPGERPICSFCARLGQFCVYADEVTRRSNKNTTAASRIPASSSEGAQKLEDRVQILEAKLTEVLEVVSQQQTQDRSGSHASPGGSRHITPSQAPDDMTSCFSASTLPPWEVVVAATEHYLLYCDCQPLPLFHRHSLIMTLRDRDPEVLFGILALALRFSHDPRFSSNLVELANGYAETARKMVMRRVSDGPVELSTLQSLCLLSLVGFTNGNKYRASIHISLAMNLAHCAGLTSESHLNFSDVMCEERRRCFWSIFLLKRLHGADACVLDFPGEENFPWYPTSPGLPSSTIGITDQPSSSASNTDPSRDEIKDAGVVAYAIQLSEVWFKTTKYARRRGTPSKMPPWSPQSEYATIVAQQMEFETRMPSIHRFKPAGFSKKLDDELQLNRDYWGPWLFIQFLYHTNLCLLNHPLILALRLRTLRSQIPEIFLQHTSDLISSHASWIIHLIDMLKAKSFKVTDPFLGHCVAIVATIHLQESFAEDPNVRKEKQINFAKCLEFVQNIGHHWPHIAQLADKLQRLQETVSTSYHGSANFQTPTRGLLIDLGRFWEILEYSSASELYDSAGQFFGSSLYLGPTQSAAEVSDTSPLPPPTRLGSACLPSNPDGGVDILGDNDALSGCEMADALLRAAPPCTNLSYEVLTEPPYSNDELAVLADSFFNQRNDFGGDVDEWWKAGNL